MELAIKPVRFAERETAQHLARMVPKCRTDFGSHGIACLNATQTGELPRHRQLRRIHRRDADVMNDASGAKANIGPFDQVTEFALIQAGSYAVAKCGHPKIAEIGADAQPIEFLG